MFEREAKLRDPVRFELDGKPFEAERGEPLAVALLAASRLRLARSPKLHRPRGPSCLRGDCDGCLARVDGVPNVMLCQRAAVGGERVETQNVLGSSDTDLLRVTDWFFPKGIDHHHLMAGIPGVHAVMQSFARKLSGIGRLPDRVHPATAARRIACEVLVVGAGLAGLSTVRALRADGVDTWLVDEHPRLGGAARFAGPEATDFIAAAEPSERELLGATVGGIFDRRALTVKDGVAIELVPRVLVLATGAHDGALAAPNNDLPGIMSARALAVLLGSGVRPRVPVALVGHDHWTERCVALLGDRMAVHLEPEDLESFEGGSRLKGVRRRSGQVIAVEVCGLGLPGAPSFELAEMAGAGVARSDHGFSVVCDADGAAGDHLFAVGECTGMAFAPSLLVQAGARVARAVRAAL